jgi:hypothetical protein
LGSASSQHQRRPKEKDGRKQGCPESNQSGLRLLQDQGDPEASTEERRRKRPLLYLVKLLTTP